MDAANGLYDEIIGVMTTYGLNVIGAIIILLVGFWLARRIAAIVRRASSRSARIDETLSIFFANLTRYLVVAVTVIAVLNQFGVQTASLIAVLGAAGLAIGLALQGTLSNVAAGVMLLMFRPFKVGDAVDAGGHSGAVKGINLFVTELATPDNVQILIPNAQVWGGAVKNFSAHATRRVDLTVGIGYGDSIDQAIAAVSETVGADQRVLPEPAAMIAVSELADSSVQLVIRFWCNSAHYWALRFAMIKAIKERLDRDGISIPYPQTDVHLVGSTAASSK